MKSTKQLRICFTGRLPEGVFCVCCCLFWIVRLSSISLPRRLIRPLNVAHRLSAVSRRPEALGNGQKYNQPSVQASQEQLLTPIKPKHQSVERIRTNANYCSQRPLSSSDCFIGSLCPKPSLSSSASAVVGEEDLHPPTLLSSSSSASWFVAAARRRLVADENLRVAICARRTRHLSHGCNFAKPTPHRYGGLWFVAFC